MKDTTVNSVKCHKETADGMKILCLYDNECALDLFEWLDKQGNTTVLWKDEIDIEWLDRENFDLAVSYTYPYIIRPGVIEKMKGRIVNLHNAYLPFDRGTSPNIWNIIEGSPRGVSIHYIDSGLDTGDIIAQKLVELDENATLRTSYMQLDKEVKNLFKTVFKNYKYWDSMRKKCIGTGTYHRESELQKIMNSFDDWNYEINVEEFRQHIEKSFGCPDGNGGVVRQ